MTRLNVHARGFTLMEIMVVIIVVAVLASVGGSLVMPMIDKGRYSACKQQFKTLKTAIQQHKTDVGFYPFIGGFEATTNDQLMSDDSSNNALVFDGAATLVTYSGVTYSYNVSSAMKYKKKWKGPYMDSDAEQFMIDPWGRKIRVAFHYRKAFLQSAGPDGQFDSFWDADIGGPSDIATPAYSGDDVVLLVASKLDIPP